MSVTLGIIKIIVALHIIYPLCWLQERRDGIRGRRLFLQSYLKFWGLILVVALGITILSGWIILVEFLFKSLGA